MGGMVDCGVAIDSNKTSPRRAAIEKAQEDLRLEYDVREVRRRELEFLEKGGNPLDFKFGNVASLSVQSTSLNVTSEAKGSFAFAPSPHGDSVESSGPNMADNLLLLDGDNSNAGTQVKVNNANNNNNNNTNTNTNTNNDNNNNNNNAVGTKDSEEPGILRFARRNRSRSNAGTRSSALVSSKSEEKEKNKENVKEKNKENEKDKEKEKEIVSNPLPASPIKREVAPKTVQDPVEKDDDAKDVKVASKAVQDPVEKDDIVKDIIKVVAEDKPEFTERVIDTDMDISVENPEIGTDTGTTGTGTAIEAINNNTEFSTGTGTAVEETNNNPETEIVTPSTVPKAETETASTTGTDVLTENGETSTVMQLGPKPAQLEITGTVDPVKDEKGEEEKDKIEKPVEEIKIVKAVEEEIKIKEMDTNVNNEVEVVTQPTEEELKSAKKEYEDSVLKQARVIEGNIKKAGETPSSKLPLERRIKSQWDFVLEEMAWLANDFMQERLWKTAAASQMCKWIANGGRVKFDESNLHKRQKNVALKLAKAVVKFWHSIDELRKQGENCMKEDKDSNSRQGPLGIRAYAIRVLEYNMSGLCEAPSTADNRPCRTGVLLVVQQLPEERLFYTLPAGAMQAYRDSIESQFAHLKKTGNAAHHEDCETSNSIADTRMENAYEEDEVQTGYKNTYDSGFTSRFVTKKRKHPDHHQKGSYEQPNKCNSPVKLNNNSPNILRIPTKRVRTNIQTGRKLVAGPVMKMDASSDNTNSYQQEGTLQHCDSFNKRSLNLEVESPVDSFNNNKMRGLPYDELALKKKKKKQKVYGDHYVNEPHPSVGPSKNPMYEHRVKAEGAFQHDQKDHLKKRMESHQFDPNNNNVAYGQQRKPKMLNASSQEGGAALMSASQSLNTVSNPKQLIKFVNSNRDRALTARKGKGIKLAGGHSGPGNPWSNFEDQALVVLVHDMGPNWELISDAINSALRFKCIYKRAKECKERHKFLMDKSVGDGADSAEDSGSSQSQPYPSTLPGIPKGFAGTLFQKLRGPVEEDTIKTHFEKIISLSQKLRPRNNQELKQITPAHSSHVAALSQVLPNNLSGTVLTPLDLCDAPSPPQEMPTIGYGGPHGNGLPLTGPLPGPPASNMGPVMQQGSAGLLLPGTLPSPSTPLNAASSRDAQQRYGVPRGPPVQSDEHQQRMQQQQQQYNHHMVSGRGLPIPGSIPGNMRMLPGSAPGCSNGMMQPGMMRAMTQPIPRPSYPRLSNNSNNNNNNNNNAAGPGQGMLNMVSPSPPGSMISATGPGPMQPGPINPRMLRPIQNNMDEHNRHMMMHELQQQMPAQQVNNNGGVSSAAASSPLQSFPPVQPQVGPQAPHQQVFTNHPTPQQQAYAIRFAKQMQQQQQQQQRMNPPAQQMTSMMTSSAVSPSPPVGVGVGPSQQQIMKNNNLPEGPVPKKQKLNAQQRQNNQSAKGGPKGRGGSILMQPTLGGGINNNMNSNNNNQQPMKFSSPMTTMAPPGSSVSSSGNPAAQEGVSGNEMLIGQSRPVLGPNQGFIGGAHWQNKNQVQQSSSGNNSNSNNNNNNNRAVVQGNVYAQPSNSGPG